MQNVAQRQQQSLATPLAPDGLVCLGILYLLLCQEILDVTSATLRQAEEKEEEFAWSDLP